jgi:ADP-heptose:LPS heptosyltransferase
MKVLVIQQKMIGDVLTCSMLCEMIKNKHPEYEVHYLVNSNTQPVVTNNPFVDKLVLFTPDFRKNKLKLIQFLFHIRKEKYDVVIDAYGKLESNLITLFSGAKTKISYTKAYNKFLYTNPINPLQGTNSNLGLAIENRQQLLSPLNIYHDFKVLPKIYLDANENKKAITLLQKNSLDTRKKIIMVSIIGSSKNKTYPLTYMSKVIDCINKQTNCNLLFNYIPNQLADAQIVYDNCAESTKKQIYFNVLGKNLREFIAIMNQCDYIIGNDGGAINMAKALNKPSFIIFSPWIEKKVWATFEDGLYHQSVHLKDYLPKLFEGKTTAFLKKNSIDLYQHFKPELLTEALQQYLIKLNKTDTSSYKLSESVIINDKPKISALIITKNEELNIKAVIENLSFVDEIIVVDSFSTDGTIEKLSGFKNITTIQREFKNFANQRNFALQQATHDWVLFIDADERITNKLKTEIINTINNPTGAVAFMFKRIFFFKKKRIRFSGFQTDTTYRLFKKNKVKYIEDKIVHEMPIVNGESEILKNNMLHFCFESTAHYKAKMEHYASLKALELFKKGKKPNAFHFYLRPIYKFIVNYFFRLGFLDGKEGLIICYLSAYGVNYRYKELKKLIG